MSALALADRQRLDVLEDVIERGLSTFLDVGRALGEIYDRKLYRPRTWSDYCWERWGFGRVYAWRLIEAVGVVDSLPVGNQPTNERQARELVPLDPEERQEVWTEATAGGEQPTAARLHELAAKALASLPPDEQREVIEGAERRVMDRAPPSRMAGGEARTARITGAVRLLMRAWKLFEGLGEEADAVLRGLDRVVADAKALPD